MERILYDHFGKIENDHWWWKSRRRIVLSLLDQLLPGPGPRKILDVGCGAGALLRSLPEKLVGFGVDSSPQAVDLCRQSGLKNIVLNEADKLPFESGYFQAVIALDVLEHLDDDQTLLREASRVLENGAILIATVPAFPFLWTRWDDLNHHRRRYNSRTLIAAVSKAGFQPVYCSYINMLGFPLSMARVICEKIKLSGKDSLPVGAAIPVSPVNKTLETIFSMERLVISRRWPLPCGSSVLIHARKSKET